MGYEGPVELSGKRSPSSEAAPGTLRVRVGHASVVGARQANEDFFGVVTPDGSELAAKGILAAVADGVSGGSGGRQAAEHVVRSLLADYYATPDTWEVPLAIERVLSAANRWLLAQGAPSGMASTLSALLLRGTRYYLAHVGDTRVYRLSGDECAQLTQDHVWDRPGMQHVLKRAVGLDRHLAIDFADGELRADDAFLLCSDGVWQPLGQKRVHELLRLYDDPQFVADALVAAAL
ncbi:MAG TPA: PP2C family serine/threonine-protein phosphatase, partial [Burkholderiales bacterium]|nr:PP2C family serine/threonine-protein phosphatase [Burkholderiales bacterium]